MAITIQYNIDDKGVITGMRQINKELRSSGTSGKEAAAGIATTNSSLTTLKNILIGGGVIYGMERLARLGFDIGKNFADTAGGFEKMRISLDTITKGRGAETFKELNEWAIRMPVSTAAAVEGYTKMRAMGLEPTIKDMTTLVDTTSALGGSTEIFNGIVLAIGQIATKGKLMSQEIRQLAERGIPAYEILNEKLGITGEMLEKAGHKAIDGDLAIRALLEGMNDRFEGQSEKIRDAYQGLTTEIISNWKEFQRVLMDGGPFEFVKDQLRDIRDGTAQLAASQSARNQKSEIISILKAMGVQPNKYDPNFVGDAEYSQKQLTYGAELRLARLQGSKYKVPGLDDYKTKVAEPSPSPDVWNATGAQFNLNRMLAATGGDEWTNQDRDDYIADIAEKEKEALEERNRLTLEFFEEQQNVDFEIGEQQREMAEEQKRLMQEHIQDVYYVADTWAYVFDRASRDGDNFVEGLRNQLLDLGKSLALQGTVRGLFSLATGGGFGSAFGSVFSEFIPPLNGSSVSKPAISSDMSASKPATGGITNNFYGVTNADEFATVAQQVFNDRKVTY